MERINRYEPNKKVLKDDRNKHITIYECGICGNQINMYKDYNRCRWCRQLILWGDFDDGK